MSNLEVTLKVKEGFRLTPPSICPQEIKEIMKKCWEWDPSQRPSFEVNLSILSNFYTKYFKFLILIL